jgi:transposase
MSTDVHLPDDLALCHEIIKTLTEELEKSQQRIEKLEQSMDRLLRRIYERSSERMIDPNQGTLFDLSPEEGDTAAGAATAEPEAVEASSKPKRKGHGRRRFPKNVERREILLDIPEEEKTCPKCNQLRKEIGRIITERLGCVPMTFYVNQYVQLKYACNCEESGVVTAEKPIHPIEKGNAEPDLMAFVTVSRFDDHSPYYRQEHGAFKRAGIHIPRSTLCDWMRRIAELLRPLYDLMHWRVLKSKLLGTDDTTVPVLVRGRGTTHRGYMWAYRGDAGHPYNVFDFTMSHSRDGPLKFLHRAAESNPAMRFHGHLQADAFSGYNVLFTDGEVTEVGCWAHARRKFFEAKETNVRCGMESLARISQLYAIESDAKVLSSAERLALRQERSVPLLDSMHRWLDEQYGEVLPKSAMGEAIGYTLSNWEALRVYTTDGSFPIDNNAVERMLRTIVLGRKNWLFAGSERGGRTAAVLFSIVSSAKRHGLNTFAYLRDLLVRLADLKPGELEQLLPDHWQDSHAG